MSLHYKHTLYLYISAVVVFFLGVVVSASRYPGGYDWLHMVISTLASHKENPEGSYWFILALCISMVLLWFYIMALKSAWPINSYVDSVSLRALQIAVLAGFLVGLERLFDYEVYTQIYKLHEKIALITFMAFYVGTLGLLFRLMLQRRIYLLVLLAVAVPIVVLGGIEFWLYLSQRDIGWVGVSWGKMEIPLWLSFSFWQWLELVFLWLGLGVIGIVRLE